MISRHTYSSTFFTFIYNSTALDIITLWVFSSVDSAMHYYLLSLDCSVHTIHSLSSDCVVFKFINNVRTEKIKYIKRDMGPQRNFKLDLLKEDGNDSMKELTYKTEVERKKKMKKYSK